jgi:predicted TIM-barrel fold metal-dependent hydrolase
VLLHMGRIAPHPQLRSKFGRPIRLEDVGLACPKIKLIIGHSGCPWQWESFRMCDGFRNFFLDLTTSGSLDMQMLKLVAADKSTGVRRLVLGTDGNGGDNFKRAEACIERFRQNGFTEEQLVRIARLNALEILGEKE